MSDLHKILLTSGITVVTGLVVLVIGQLIQRLFIEPIQEQRRTLGKISYAMTFYRPYFKVRYDEPERQQANHEDCKEASDAVRQLAAELRSNVNVLPFYSLFAWLKMFRIPSRRVVKEASAHLMRWQAHMDVEHVEDAIQNLEVLLRFVPSHTVTPALREKHVKDHAIK